MTKKVDPKRAAARARARKKRELEAQEASFRFWLAAACTLVAMFTFYAVLHEDLVLLMISAIGFQAILIGALAGAAIYLHGLSATDPVNLRVVASKAAMGAVSGILADKMGAGLGLSEQLRLASAGVAGAKGPEYLDKLADSVSERIK